VYLDVNELAKGETVHERRRTRRHRRRRTSSPTRRTTRASATTRSTIKDLDDGQLFPEKVERVDSVAWAADNKTLFYDATDPAKRPFRLYRHASGRILEGRRCSRGEGRAVPRLPTVRAARRLVLVGSRPTRSSEWRYIPADSRPAELR
jgi:oligopeptidase B